MRAFIFILLFISLMTNPKISEDDDSRHILSRPFCKDALKDVGITPELAKLIVSMNDSEATDALAKCRPDLVKSNYDGLWRLLKQGSCDSVGVSKGTPYIHFWGTTTDGTSSWHIWIPLIEPKLPTEGISPMEIAMVQPLSGIVENLPRGKQRGAFEFSERMRIFSEDLDERFGDSKWNDARVLYYSPCGDLLLIDADGRCCWFEHTEPAFVLESDFQTAITRTFNAMRDSGVADVYSVGQLNAQQQ